MVKKDPNMIWDGPFPYDLLAPAGITPQSSMSEILRAMSYFSRDKSANPVEVRVAWSHLRQIEKRLFYDFFLCHLEEVAEEEE